MTIIEWTCLNVIALVASSAFLQVLHETKLIKKTIKIHVLSQLIKLTDA